MKFLVAVAAFIATIALTTQTLASNSTDHKSGTDKHDNSGMPVKGELETAKQNNEHNAHKAGHGNLVEKMNSLFPTKMPNHELAARPSTVEIKSPSFLGNVGAGPVKLEWNAVQGATNYHIQVATDPNFKWLVVNEKFLKENSYNFTAEAGHRYFWRVASYKGDNANTFTKSNFVSSAFNVK
ncbi:MAG: hypothetical protein K0R29_2430 [Pseudobdellovibrio sp.]|jgi:hypothetical protein|nr:hypothetical protein [Pseudobdellovibrio sp.]